MRTALLCLLCGVLLTACGVRKDLRRPSEIPDYEAQRAAKRKQIEEDQRQYPDYGDYYLPVPER